MVFFYLLVLSTGMWAFLKSTRKKKEQKKSAATGMEMTLLGNRSLKWVVGIFTMTGEETLLACLPYDTDLGRREEITHTKKKKMCLCGSNFLKKKLRC